MNGGVWDDLLLVLPREDAVIVCFAEIVSREDGIEKCRDRVERQFRDMEKFGLFSKSGKGPRGAAMPVTNIKRPPKKDWLETIEMQIEKRGAGGEDKTFLVRIYKREHDDRIYVAIAGVQTRRFHRLESQFREALDSVKLGSRKD